MLVSTRGRYALRVLIDLAEHRTGGFIPMKDVAERQELPIKYIERIMPLLVKGGLVEGVHGKGGGYRLCVAPEDFTVSTVLHLTEGSLAPVACLDDGASPCSRAAECRTLPMWKEFYAMVDRYFDGITLADLASTETADTYVI